MPSSGEALFAVLHPVRLARMVRAALHISSPRNPGSTTVPTGTPPSPQLALISMIDHDDRHSRQTPGTSEPARFTHAVGALFGEQIGPRAEIFMSYEMKVDIVENGHPKLDDRFLVEKLELRACGPNRGVVQGARWHRFSP